MNLTNERLKEIAESYPRLGLTETEWKSIAAELLQLRALREAREEIERMKITEKDTDRLDRWAIAKLPSHEPFLVRQLIAEVRKLRALRDAVDEEVESKVLEISRWIGNTATDSTERRSCRQAAIELQNLHDIAITRGQTRTDAPGR